MSTYPSSTQANINEEDKLKGSLNREMERKLLSEEIRTEKCNKNPNNGGHEFNHEYDKLSMVLMFLGIPMFFRYVKKQIKCKHCNKSFATYVLEL